MTTTARDIEDAGCVVLHCLVPFVSFSSMSPNRCLTGLKCPAPDGVAGGHIPIEGRQSVASSDLVGNSQPLVCPNASVSVEPRGLRLQRRNDVRGVRRWSRCNSVSTPTVPSAQRRSTTTTDLPNGSHPIGCARSATVGRTCPSTTRARIAHCMQRRRCACGGGRPGDFAGPGFISPRPCGVGLLVPESMRVVCVTCNAFSPDAA